MLDVSDPQAVAAALTGAEVDVLVNNAGIGALKPFMETTAAEWQRTIDVNVNALYHVTRAVLPSMIASGRGHVCTIGSIAGRGAFVGGSCYAATKAFVTSWSESLMLEVREHGVKVSVVMPGLGRDALQRSRAVRRRRVEAECGGRGRHGGVRGLDAAERAGASGRSADADGASRPSPPINIWP